MKTAYFLLALLLAACSPSPRDVQMVDALPPIYPDYADVTIPCNIAPLNFLLRSACDAMQVTAEADGVSIEAECDGYGARFALDDWRRLTRHREITVTVTAREEGEWRQYKPFTVTVSPDSIDPYLSYRLIEPDYEVFSRLQIMERCVENFDERPICDYRTVGNRCMNCHTYAPLGQNLSLYYLRGPGGGMMLCRGGQQTLLSPTPTPVYAQFSADGQWIVYSTNKILPGFHSRHDKRLEVFDTESDVYVYSIARDTSITCPLLADSVRLETFPTFSPDGRSIYFCLAPRYTDDIRSIQYSLCRLSFDPETGAFGNKIDTIVAARQGEKRSVCHPRVSPDGRRLLYTVAHYGTFPIWHPEADQQMLDLSTGRIDTLQIVNSDKSDTYHSWSSSGRWFVFASKRDDGLYGKPYFCHIDTAGHAAKPFVLPQQDPTFYDTTLKSFNIPELGCTSRAKSRRIP